MDAYLPPLSDERTARPVIVYIHGGGFYTGSKENTGGVDFLRHMVRKGYAGISINYRTTKSFYDENPGEFPHQHVMEAVEDARAAVRFLVKNAQHGRFDTDRIALYGTSAGAVTALAYGYVAEAQFEG